MAMMKQIYIIVLLVLIGTTAKAQTTDMARGADVSWCTEMEAAGRKFYNAEGTERELMTLMKEIGMTAIRLRVWVNPSQYGYGAWCDKADVLVRALRAKNAGLDLMIDFHYSDFFADPGRQDTPLDWQGYSLEQMKTAVANHTQDVLQALKDQGVEPKWVQVGNETSVGMIWDTGKIDWDKSGSARYANYVALSNAGYDAVKAVLPNALVIVHHDNAFQDLEWFYRDFKNAGGKFDVIGLSHYPDYDNWASQTSGVVSNYNAAKSVKTLGATFDVPVMIVETGYDSWSPSRASEVMANLMTRMKEIPQCAGVFYWEPEVDGQWKPAYYGTIGWNAYKMGAFTTGGKPTAALDAFSAGTSSVESMQHVGQVEHATYYDLKGNLLSSPVKGVTIERRGKEVRKVLQ